MKGRKIYNRIAVLRQEQGISRKQLAEVLGVNFQTVQPQPGSGAEDQRTLRVSGGVRLLGGADEADEPGAPGARWVTLG
jgi:hypothetical protein